jgi:molecular chaperone GrpE
MTEQEPVPDAGETAEVAEATVLFDRIAELEDELAKTKDQLLRALAEQENIRRRAQRDKEDSVRYAAANFAKDLISTPDNLRRALDSVKAEELTDELGRTLLTGVAATERALLGTFERHGIRQIAPLGEKFDHNLHQALFEVENTGKPAGTVVQVLAPGYVLHDRLLRAAMVGVAKGPVAKTEAEPGPATGDEPAAAPRRRVDTTA